VSLNVLNSNNCNKYWMLKKKEKESREMDKKGIAFVIICHSYASVCKYKRPYRPSLSIVILQLLSQSSLCSSVSKIPVLFAAGTTTRPFCLRVELRFLTRFAQQRIMLEYCSVSPRFDGKENRAVQSVFAGTNMPPLAGDISHTRCSQDLFQNSFTTK